MSVNACVRAWVCVHGSCVGACVCGRDMEINQKPQCGAPQHWRAYGLRGQMESRRLSVSAVLPWQLNVSRVHFITE